MKLNLTSTWLRQNLNPAEDSCLLHLSRKGLLNSGLFPMPVESSLHLRSLERRFIHHRTLEGTEVTGYRGGFFFNNN